MKLHQWFTPAWAAEAIVDQEFGWLRPEHRVVEPACGDGYTPIAALAEDLHHAA